MTSYIGLIPHPATERIDRGATWSDPEVDELLNIWTNESVQAELKEATIKKHIFERIARSLRDKGFYRTAEQCREKIKRLKKEYRQAKNNNYRCVRGRATVKFFPRLQAVLEGKPGGNGTNSNNNNNNNLGGNDTKFNIFSYEGKYHPSSRGGDNHTGGSGGGTGSGSTPNNYIGIKGSPHSFSDYTAEEIKCEVNPAEVDNDSCNSELAAEEADDLVAGEILRRSVTPNSRHFSNNHHFLNHSLLQAAAVAAHHLPISAHSNSLNNNNSGSNHNHSNHRGNHQALALTVHNSHHPLNYSINNNNLNNSNNNNNNGVLRSGRLTEDERECASEASSSRATSPNLPRNLRALSPTDSIQPPRRKRLKRSHHASSSGNANNNLESVRDTLDNTLDRFLKHQREAEERLFAWEERRIQMELEAEERWRQEDREMLRQIVTHLYLASTHNVSNASTSTATNTTTSTGTGSPISPPLETRTTGSPAVENHTTSSSTSSDQEKN